MFSLAFGRESCGLEGFLVDAWETAGNRNAMAAPAAGAAIG